jgi:hypothetical protein
VRRVFKVLSWVVVIGVLLLVAIQFVPYGRAHENPPVTATPTWDSPRTEELVRSACYDCHSNETQWPWYTHVAPASWLVARDVEEGRQHLNFSEWSFTPQEAGFVADEIAQVVGEGEMPPLQYRLIHSEARLSDGEKQELIDGVNASFGQ